MEFLTSSKGKQQLVLDGYLYSKQKNLAGGIISWECVKRRNERSCAAKIKTLNEQVVGRINVHRCVIEPERLETRRVRANMREDAQNTRERPRNIIMDEVYGQNGDVLATLPSQSTMARTIRRQRQKIKVQNVIPHNDDLLFEIPEEYRLSSTGEPFLRYNINVHNNERMLIFASDEGVRFFSQ